MPTARQVAFHADYRFDVGFAAGAVEIKDAEHDAVIGDAEGGHFQFAGAFDECLDPALAIKQGEFAMDV